MVSRHAEAGGGRRMTAFEAARTILGAGVRDGAFPAAVVEAGDSTGPVWREAFGALGAAPAAVDTVFDLASLTKVIATTTLAMQAVDRRIVDLDAPVGRWLAEWRGADRAVVSVADLLAHASGLTAHLPLFRDCRGRAEFERAICATPLEYDPRSASVYSDLGFILLGFILEDACGARLDAAFRSVVERFGWGELRFRPRAGWRRRTAPTEVDPWRGRLLVGEVHDENAWALGGVAGHAGLFGTAAAVGRFARTIAAGLRNLPTVAGAATLRRFTDRSAVPGSSRALGWDTMLPTSSCGARMSAAAVGHTGFTGTSLWIDPEADTYVVLLTNRVHPTRANEAILGIRPALHDAVMSALGR